MDIKEYDFLIVGSGAGGATVAMELAKKGRRVLVIERGIREQKVGTFRDSLRYYDMNRLTRMPPRSKGGATLWRTFMAGGPTVVSCGNGVRCLEKELAAFGINLDSEFAEAEEEMKIVPYDERRLSKGSKKILEASRELGYQLAPMPKFIDPAKCRRCGACQLGCKYDAKWTALRYLDEAAINGAEILYKTGVQKVIVENGRAMGVNASGPGGRFDIMADTVILAAGGMGTPVILQNSGVEKAGEGLFMDLLVNTYGVTKDLSQTDEPTMALVDHEFYESKGFILSPFLNQPAMVRFLELGVKGMFMPAKRMLGIMTKIADEPAGRVYPDRKFFKPVTQRDRQRLHQGSSISREILVKAGADSSSIVVSKVQGAHPGGTAAIGSVVDENLQTKIENLFVCDGSVLPTAPGMPPILTIAALGKRLAKALA